MQAKPDLQQPQPPQADQQGTPNKPRPCDRYGFQGKADFNQNRNEYGKAKGAFKPPLRPFDTPLPVWPLSSRHPAAVDRAKPELQQ